MNTRITAVEHTSIQTGAPDTRTTHISPCIRDGDLLGRLLDLQALQGRFCCAKVSPSFFE